MIQPDLEQIQTAVNCPGSKVEKAIVSCFPLINKNKCIAVSCFLQGHCFPGQEEALCGGPGANFICTLKGQIMSTSRRCKTEEQHQPRPGQLVSMQVEPFPCLDYLVGPKACNSFSRKKEVLKIGLRDNNGACVASGIIQHNLFSELLRHLSLYGILPFPIEKQSFC